VTVTSPDLNFGDYAPCFTGGESPRYPVSTTLRENLGPWADARGSPFPPLPLPQEKEVYTGPGEVYFDGSKSIDFDGSIAEYEWDFGQGTVKEGVSVSYIYSEEGDYLVKLTVTDDDDLDDVDVVRVYIHPLEAHIIKPTNEAVFYQIPDSEIIFLGEGKYGTPCTPPDDPYRYRWILDTSSFLSDEENFTRSASTLSKGPHELTLKVEDCKEKMAEDKVLIYIVERKVSAQILEPSKDGEVVDCDGKFKGNVSGGLPPYKVKWKAEGIVFDEGTINVEFGVHETSKRPTPGTVDITFEAEDQYSDRGEDEKKNIEIASCNPCDDFKVTGKLPEKFDWRKWEGRNYNSPVKDQGYCGSCWAHSALGSMEGIHEVEQWDPDLNPDLSEQYLVSDCCEGNCNGGRPDTAFSYIQGEGVSGEDCYPYRASNSPCSERCPDWSSRLWKIASHGSVSSNRDEIKEALICRGPLSVCSDNWMHCIVLSGYDDG
jgi:PKD repeat protein